MNHDDLLLAYPRLLAPPRLVAPRARWLAIELGLLDRTRPRVRRQCTCLLAQLLGVVVEAVGVETSWRTPALMRERGAECRKRIPIRTDRLR